MGKLISLLAEAQAFQQLPWVSCTKSFLTRENTDLGVVKSLAETGQVSL